MGVWFDNNGGRADKREFKQKETEIEAEIEAETETETETEGEVETVGTKEVDTTKEDEVKTKAEVQTEKEAVLVRLDQQQMPHVKCNGWRLKDFFLLVLGAFSRRETWLFWSWH